MDNSAQFIPSKIKRPNPTSNGTSPHFDPKVRTILDELNTLLGKRVFRPAGYLASIKKSQTESDAQKNEADKALAAKKREVSDADKVLSAARAGEETAVAGLDAAKQRLSLAKPVDKDSARVLVDEAEASLKAAVGKRTAAELRQHELSDEAEVIESLLLRIQKRDEVLRVAATLGLELPATVAKSLTFRGSAGKWEGGSLASVLKGAAEDETFNTLSELVDATPELSTLKQEFRGYQAKKPPLADPTVDELLRFYPSLRDYLIAYGFHVRHLVAVSALGPFLYEHPSGGKQLVNYAVVGATRLLIAEEKLDVEDVELNHGSFVTKLIAAKVPLSSLAFAKAAKASINDFQFNTDEADIIDKSAIGKNLPANLKPLLIKSMQVYEKSGIKIGSANADFHLPVLLSQVLHSQGYADPADIEPQLDQDFDVQFRDDADAVLADVSRSAVRCAAQLYHSMVLGDQLDVFGAVSYFTHKHLVRGGLEIRDRRLRSDLQLYVFSNRFIDLATNRVTDCTRLPERQMFYRQVFAEGSAAVTEDVLVNADFRRLWNVMVLECAKYLQRANSTFNTQFLSKQQIQQSVEDLQYNLSTSCTGMVNVIAPLIDAELNFVLQRILKHSEVIQSVVPSGGTWKRAVEALCIAAHRSKPRASTLYNKAAFGMNIIRVIADYDPVTFESEHIFDPFISTVDAFITTQSILQESVLEGIVNEDTAVAPSLEEPEEADSAGDGGDAVAAGEWDF